MATKKLMLVFKYIYIHTNIKGNAKKSCKWNFVFEISQLVPPGGEFYINKTLFSSPHSVYLCEYKFVQQEKMSPWKVSGIAIFRNRLKAVKIEMSIFNIISIYLCVIKTIQWGKPVEYSTSKVFETKINE